MKPSLDEFLAKDGEPWKPKLRKFVRFVVEDYLKLSVAGPGQRLHQSRQGKVIVNEEPVVNFRGAFYVSLRPATLEARVSPGRVNGLVPSIGGIDLNGKDVETGRADAKGPPLVKLTGGPGEDGISYVVIQVRLGAGTGEIAIGELGNDAVTIAHVKTIDAGLLSAGAEDRDGIGIDPIAEIEWRPDGRAPLRVRQMVYFDRQHRYLRDAGGGPGRHVFGAAA